MSNPKCIYCHSTGPFSDEHPVSACLGEFEGFPHLIDRVCRSCNSKRLGPLEEQLGRSGPEAFFRQYLGIHGRKKHNKVNVFHRRSAGTEPIDMTACLPGTDVEVLWEFNRGERTVREVRQLVILDQEGRSVRVRIREPRPTAAEIREMIGNGGLKGSISAQVFGTDEDLTWAEEMAGHLSSSFSRRSTKPNEVISDPVVQVTVTDKYFRAIAKVALHYLLAVVPDFRGDESAFARLRKFILLGEKVDEVWSQSREPIITFPHPQIRPRGWGHIILVENDATGIRARIQFFIGPRHDPLTHAIRLTSDGTRMQFRDWVGHYFYFFEDGPHGKYHGGVSPLECGTSPDRPPRGQSPCGDSATAEGSP